MFSLKKGRSAEVIKLPNHMMLYGVIVLVLGLFVVVGSATRIYELREFFPIKLPEQINDFIMSYIPFIVGTFITSVAALAGLIVGINWILGGLRQVSRFRLTLKAAGDYFQPEYVSLGLKEGKLRSYDKAPSLLFLILGRIWSNAGFISEIPGQIARWNLGFIWKAAFLSVFIHFLFKSFDYLPAYLDGLGLGTGYVLPSPWPFYHLLAAVCGLKLLVAFSLIPLKKPGAGREMDSMIVEGKGHPSVFFAMIEEGSKIFANKGFSNKIARSKPVLCEDRETLMGTLIESFPEYIKTTSRVAALMNLFLGAVMVLTGFLQIILMQYPSFSVTYQDFFRLYFFSLLTDIALNVSMILLGKGFLDQAFSLMAVYRFRSNLVYVESKGDYDRQLAQELKGIVSPERLFNPLTPCAFNVRYFSAEAISEAITPQGVRELVGLETSARLAKDVSRLKFLPFQVKFVERYPSSWKPYEDGSLEVEEQIVSVVEDNAPEEDEEIPHAVIMPSNCP